MEKLNIYITEAWGRVKKQSLKSDMEAWCDEMGIEKYTINSKYLRSVYDKYTKKKEKEDKNEENSEKNEEDPEMFK